MFKFLKLRNSASGDARRHVPFTSIIHKPLSIVLSLVLVFIFVSCPQAASAEALPMPPIWLPMNPYSSEGIRADFVVLNDDQKKIAKELIGAYGSIFFGLASNPLQNPFDTVAKVRDWWYETGDQIYDQFVNNLDPNSSREMQNMIGSCIVKASNYQRYQDYVAQTDPESGNHSYIQVPPELTVAFKNWYAVNGGVYDWQFQTKPFSSSVAWKTTTIPGTVQTDLNNLYNTYSYLPSIRANDTSANQYYVKFFDDAFSVYHNIFVNTSQHTVAVCDDSGNILGKYTRKVAVNSANPNAYTNTAATAYSQVTYNPNNYSSYVDLVRAYYNFALAPYGNFRMFYEDFVDHVYVGANWNSKEEIYNIDDLNIGMPTSNYIDQTNEDAFTDINGLLGSLGASVTDVKQGVIDNTVVRDGENVIPYEDALIKAIDKYLSTPSSGVIFDPDVFAPFFDKGKGFISYMWFMTKPLIQYTKDFVTTITFDPVDGFNASGPGYFIYGVVALGLIGGVVVKFLL